MDIKDISELHIAAVTLKLFDACNHDYSSVEMHYLYGGIVSARSD